MKERLDALAGLGSWFNNLNESQIEELYRDASNSNNWFTEESVRTAFNAWAACLTKDNLELWTSPYNFGKTEKKVGLVMAGNIPLVGLHDLLTVLVSGHRACIKYSSQDTVLMKVVVQALIEIEPRFKDKIVEVERLNDMDAVIATGSDNSARYFKHYFSKIPHLIRQNRVSIGIISGKESDEDIQKLGKDIFTYFSLGCRNVSKIFIPEGYELPKLIAPLDIYDHTLEHHKYRNNYEYNKSIYLVNKEPHLDSGFFLMRESTDLVSPISVIYYEHYRSEAELSLKLSTQSEKIQCIVSMKAWYEGSLSFGEAQQPDLWDYADGVDTLEFLTELK